jgi:hypothetical protein
MHTSTQSLELIYRACYRADMRPVQGTLTEGEGSVQLTSSSDQQLWTLQTLFTFFTNKPLNEEVNRTKPFSVSVPWSVL